MRKSGVLMHLSSLSSPYGIGTMGKEAYKFVDFLKDSGQSYWQILPVCPTSYGDSPYQSYSTYAGNPYFIDLDILSEQGLLDKSDYIHVDWENIPTKVNYGVLYEKRYPILRIAADNFLKAPTKEYEDFCEANKDWLQDFALFMTLKDVHQGASWNQWSAALRNYEEDALRQAEKEHEDTIAFWKVVQFFFFEQWKALKTYANVNGISIIGDLPIYVSLDSVDVWAHPELFQLDENKCPKEVAGCPPDGFSEVGQLWGNPLYDWDYMEKHGFTWWISRIQYLCNVYDTVRIDHFRGFDSYYAIPAGSPDARTGSWRQGPGMKLFHAIEKAIGKQSIIAEDLGYLTDSVKKLLSDSGFPGMKVLEFAFDSRDSSGDEYLLHNFIPNCVAYAGTHDNDTIMGWFKDIDEQDYTYVKEYLQIPEGNKGNWIMIESLWRSVADLTIVQAQDLLELGTEARMNQPSTLGNNWCWRAMPDVFTKEMSAMLRHKMRLYGRLAEK